MRNISFFRSIYWEAVYEGLFLEGRLCPLSKCIPHLYTCRFLVRLKEHLRSHDFQEDQEEEEDLFEPAAIEVYDSSKESSLHAE